MPPGSSLYGLFLVPPSQHLSRLPWWRPLVPCFGDAQIIRTLMSDTKSLNKNNVQQSMLFLLYSVGFSIGPVIGGVLVAANFRWVFAIK